MKRIFRSFALAGLVSLGAPSVQAADFEPETAIQQLVVSGVVESWTGYTFYSGFESGDGGSEDLEDGLYSSYSGRLSLPLGDRLSAQMDASLEVSSDHLYGTSADDEDRFEYGFQGIVHFSSRDPDTGLFGVFGGIGDGAADGGEYPFYVAGGEAQLYLPDFTFYVQGGYFNTTSKESQHDDDGMQEAWFGRGVVRWFPTEDSRFQAEVSYADGIVDKSESSNAEDDGHLVEWAVRYDTLLTGLPVIGDAGVFVGYRGGYFENEDENERYTDHTVMVGFRHAFGGNSIKETDRIGATLDAPNFGRWVASGNITD
ncbi:MAG: hypothetical protein AAGA00_07720 [Pseudomonadota bacterium]